MAERVGLQVKVKGIVQGVGFRPFVYQLANRLELKGWVRNTTAGVDIQVDGSHDALQNFVESLRTQAPPLAHIDEIQTLPSSANGFTEFHIEESRSISEAFQPISPDVAICPDCLRELFDPQDRHYRYPFVNCTHCGPRFTIIRDLPYDRPNTTMAGFAMCSFFQAEDGIRDDLVTGVQTCALPISPHSRRSRGSCDRFPLRE